jgi:SAM-dependent methyltransferase
MAREPMAGAEYLQGWHHRHPGATSAMLDSLTDETGRNSYEVLAEVIQDGDEPVLDLACGDGYLLELLQPNHVCVGMDWNAAELEAASRRMGHAPIARADAVELPVAMAAFGAVTCHFALMLLQPLEGVLAEAARVLRPDGIFATVLPAPPRENTPNPISVFRDAWQEVSKTYPVDIPPIQDDRALHLETLKTLLATAGFDSVLVQSFSGSKTMTVDEAVRFLLMTYLPDLLPPAGFADLMGVLRVELGELGGDTGRVTFVEHSDLVTARRL